MSESTSDDFSDIDYGLPQDDVDQSDQQHHTFVSDESDPDQDLDENLDDRQSAAVESLTEHTTEKKEPHTDAQLPDLYYNPRDYDSLSVNNEVRRLFEYIERFKFNEIELETELKPFIPDYIPSIGNVDCFIKPAISADDYLAQEDKQTIGIHYLDEPILHQSDPSTFYLKLANESKQISVNQHSKISSIVDAEKNTNKIRNWIDNFKKIKHKSVAGHVHVESLSHLPNVEELIERFTCEESKSEMGHIPSYEDCSSLKEYATQICGALDIPIHEDDLTTSLHLLFSTYAAMQSITPA